MFWLYSGYVLIMFWLCLCYGYVMVMFRICSGYIPDMLQICSEYPFAETGAEIYKYISIIKYMIKNLAAPVVYPICILYVLDIYWLCSGYVLVCSGYVLVMFRLCSGLFW